MIIFNIIHSSNYKVLPTKNVQLRGDQPEAQSANDQPRDDLATLLDIKSTYYVVVT